MKILNLTPHDLNIVIGDHMVTIPASGTVARVATSAVQVGTVDVEGVSVPLVSTTYGEVEGLPAPENGTLYIVSALVLAAAKAAGRTDVIAPDTSPASAVRNDAGQIIGVRRFTR